MKQTITRKGSFDAGHRVMHEKVKCFNVHGHLYQYELAFRYGSMKDIGYAIDFKEIKRIACQFIDDYFDHGFIANPMDKVMIDACVDLNSKIWIMSLNINDRNKFCNPTVENISKEIYLAVECLMQEFQPLLQLESVRVFETPNCFVDCNAESISYYERTNFLSYRGDLLKEYRRAKGVVEYDDRLQKQDDMRSELLK
jgi:6-pyruvoyltetrahydropterin/6-carboxytetrahydropterin synthase